MHAEIAFYRPRMNQARDAASLARLRRACVETVQTHLDLKSTPIADVEAAMLAALHFKAFPDAEPALRRWKAAGIKLVVVSNWDASLPQVLHNTGLAPYLDGWVASAVLGAAKPDPAPVRAGLQQAGTRPDQAWLVGDSPDADVGAARAAGVTPVLVDRTGTAATPPDPTVRTVATLGHLP